MYTVAYFHNAYFLFTGVMASQIHSQHFECLGIIIFILITLGLTYKISREIVATNINRVQVSYGILT